MATTLIAYDGSGSTGNAANYHRLTQEIVKEQPNATILFWDSSHRIISREELKTINDGKRGFGGTYPKEITSGVKETNFHGHLIIISDGQVSSTDVDQSDKSLGEWKFERVSCHLIDTGGAVNMSISCPFTRHCPHEVFVYNPANGYSQTRQVAVSNEDFEMLAKIHQIATLEEYEKNAESLERAVVARTMGTTGDPSLRDALLAMKKRIVASESKAKSGSGTVATLEEAVKANRLADALSAAAELVQEYYGDDDELTFSGKISRLISMCEGALRGAFDLSGINAAIRGDRARRAGQAAAAPASAAPLTEDSEGCGGDAQEQKKFVCPILIDDENDPILLVSVGAGEPVLAGFDKDIANNLFDCPLNMFLYHDVVDKFIACIDHPIGLRAYREADEAGLPITISPFTRKDLIGAICLGRNEEHCKATTWTLSQCLLGGKLIGNQDLWYACVWLLVETGRIPYLADILPHLRAHMKYRLENHSTFISMSGLAEYPTTRVKLGVACWFVLASSAMKPALPANRDVLRMHLPHVSEIQKLVELAGCAIPEGVADHILRLRIMLNMLSWVKKDRFRLPMLMQGLTQRCLKINLDNVSETVREHETRVSEWIPVDGPAPDDQVSAVLAMLPASYQKLPIADLIALAALVDPSKSAADIPVAFNWTSPPAPSAILAWAYGLGPFDIKPIAICPATCRPYAIIRNTPWKTVAEEVYAIPVSQMISCHARHIFFVQKHNKYPNRDEILTYLFNRYIVHGSNNTLPAMVEQFVLAIFDDYKRAFPDGLPDITEFKTRTERSLSLDDRIAIESRT